MRRTWILSCLFLLIVPVLVHAAELVCGEHDLLFGCTQTEERGRLRAGCGVHEGGRFFASAWRVHDLKTEKVLGRARTGPDGIALIEIPKAPHYLEGYRPEALNLVVEWLNKRFP